MRKNSTIGVSCFVLVWFLNGRKDTRYSFVLLLFIPGGVWRWIPSHGKGKLINDGCFGVMGGTLLPGFSHLNSILGQ
jgi:hypothetical protein